MKLQMTESLGIGLILGIESLFMSIYAIQNPNDIFIHVITIILILFVMLYFALLFDDLRISKIRKKRYRN